MIRDKYAYEQKKYNREPKKVFRFLALLIDILLLFVTYFASAQIVKSLPISSSLKDTYSFIQERKDDYAVETKYGFKVYEFPSSTIYYIHNEENPYVVYCYNATDKEARNYIDNQEEGTEVYLGYEYYKENADSIIKRFNKKLSEDKELGNLSFKYMTTSYLLLVSTFIPGEIILFLIIPLINKDRATIGHLIFKIKTINNRNDENAKWWQVLIKFVYIVLIETLIPLLMINAVVVSIFVLIIDMGMILMSQHDRTLRDMVSMTKHIEKNTYSPTVPITDLGEEIK